MKTSLFFLLLGIGLMSFSHKSKAQVGSGEVAQSWKLVQARNINGIPFDGSADIVVPISTPTFNKNPGRLLSTTGSDNTWTTTGLTYVSYTVNFSIALLAAASNGVVSLDYSTDSGSTWQTVNSVKQQYSVAVTLTMNTDNPLCGFVPSGALVRLYRSANTNCTVTLGGSGKQNELTF